MYFIVQYVFYIEFIYIINTESIPFINLLRKG